ncbi:hypothetical protein M9Y10_016381 [Tritrichomonas musculus]|uniref:non-specific serine/threonine protein kinase n=1 Tax=Tritrichomonas musculus TaxID=1915356 RepID=A0ABR2HWV3_9EUKA
MNYRAIQREHPKYNIETVSKVYANVNKEKGPEWYDSEHWEIPAGKPDEYEIESWIGSGKYSDVFIGYKGNQKVALKVLKPVRPQKYNREAKILCDLKGGTNIIQLIEIVQNPINHQYTIISEYIKNVEYTKLYRNFKDNDCRYYLFQLMRALQFSHSQGIMHRDVKPQNIMYDSESKKLRLIDWGLAEFYIPKNRYNIHVASRHFKAIELLVDYQCYDYSVDIWGFGVTMASIISDRIPFFHGSDDFDMVAKICQVLGKNDLNAYLNKYGIDIPDEMKKKIPKSPKERRDLTNYFQNPELSSPEAIDLINRCLRYDHMERITADEALMHPYFDPVRNMK